MKKSLIVIVSAVYFIAIILVAFLGFVAEANNAVVYADEVRLIFTKEMGYSNIQEHSADFVYNGAVIYTVRENTTYDPEYGKEDDELDIDKKYKYVFTFQEDAYTDIFFPLLKEIQLNAVPISYQEGAEVTDKRIGYNVPKNYAKALSVDENGKVTFLLDTTTYICDMLLRSLDGGSANTETRIIFVWS